MSALWKKKFKIKVCGYELGSGYSAKLITLIVKVRASWSHLCFEFKKSILINYDLVPI